jgi:solute carrier family 8 (sodium/calcium exchanger)
VTIIDDDEPGVLCFEKPMYEFTEDSQTEKTIGIERCKGSSGNVWCHYEIVGVVAADCDEGVTPAVPGEDYEASSGRVDFVHNACTAQIKVKINNNETVNRVSKFRIVLKSCGGDPHACHFEGGEGQLELSADVVVKSDPQVREKVDNLKKQIDAYMLMSKIGTGSWGEQFVAAVYCNGDREAQAEATKGEWVMHFIAFPWKVFFALIPPSEYCNGYVCFWSSLLMIAVVTAIVGDLAELLGCAIGMTDDITAITIVALGTSLPDTFASRTAALQDPYADASIGNITGSNSVNVFLGLGLPWSVGAIYWSLMFETRMEDWMRRPVFKGRITPSFRDYYVDPLKYPDAFKYPEGGFMVPRGSVGTSVGIYTILAIVAVFFLIFRRKIGGGELGGPTKKGNLLSSFFLVGLWACYITLSIVLGRETTD